MTMFSELMFFEGNLGNLGNLGNQTIKALYFNELVGSPTFHYRTGKRGTWGTILLVAIGRPNVLRFATLFKQGKCN